MSFYNLFYPRNSNPSAGSPILPMPGSVDFYSSTGSVPMNISPPTFPTVYSTIPMNISPTGSQKPQLPRPPQPLPPQIVQPPQLPSPKPPQALPPLFPQISQLQPLSPQISQPQPLPLPQPSSLEIQVPKSLQFPSFLVNDYGVIPMDITQLEKKTPVSPKLPRVVSKKTISLDNGKVKETIKIEETPNKNAELDETIELKEEPNPVVKSEDSYTKIEIRGKGGFGEVWKAINKNTGKTVALKIIKIPENNIKVLKMAETEVLNLEKISSPKCYPFISCYYDHFYDRNNRNFYIEMEYIQGQDLLRWSTNFSKRDLYINLLYVMIDISKALQYVHSKGLVHKDLKPENILITSDSVPKLVDFGLACQTETCYASTVVPLETKCCLKKKGGTPVYMPPETVEYGVNYFVSDVWGLGATIFAVASNTFPFNADVKDINAVLSAIISQNPNTLNTSNPILNDAVNSCLVKSPLTRIKLNDLLKFLEDNRRFFKDY